MTNNEPNGEPTMQTSLNADDVNNLANPHRGELYRILPDGRWAFFFDSHTISSFVECEQKGVYSVLERLRLKGPERPCISVGSWWSRVSEKFYTEAALSEVTRIGETDGKSQIVTPQYIPIQRMAQIAIEAWVENNMDVMALTHKDKYEKFAMPVDASMFASMLGLQGFDHVMMLSYQKKAKALRKQAEDMAKDEFPVPSAIQALVLEAERLDKLTTLPLGPILMACQYYAQYAENDFRNWQIIGAENPFGGQNEVLVGEDANVVLYYQGRPDLVIYEKPTDSLMPLDQKTKEYIDKNVDVVWKPHSQLAGYIFATQHVAQGLGFDRTVDRCLVSVCARNVRKTPLKKGEKEKPRFHRVRPTYTPQEIEEWQRTMMTKANRLRRALEFNDITRADGFICHVFNGCDYRRLCSQPAGARQAIKNVDYVQVKPWSPLFEDDDD